MEYPSEMVGRIRPGFESDIELSPDDVQEAVRGRLRAPACPVSGLVAAGRLELHVHGAQQHLWSPQLIVDVTSLEEGEEGVRPRSRLRARFGPHPSVWTMYVAGYAACTFVAFVGASFAFAQYVMGQPPWALLSIVLAAFLSLGLYLLALLGQGFGDLQMQELRSFLESTLHEASERAPAKEQAPSSEPVQDGADEVTMTRAKAARIGEVA